MWGGVQGHGSAVKVPARAGRLSGDIRPADVHLLEKHGAMGRAEGRGGSSQVTLQQVQSPLAISNVLSLSRTRTHAHARDTPLFAASGWQFILGG